jgi:hypothetical protein
MPSSRKTPARISRRFDRLPRPDGTEDLAGCDFAPDALF